ncbi:MAG: SCO1664 family protein [Nitrospinota bacterium]
MGEPQAPRRLTIRQVGELLLSGAFRECRLLPWGSNYTFLAALEDGDLGTLLAVYKPEEGERPLWDFPPGLHRREYAAFLVSEQLGWGLVPPTVIRDGPHGVGSVQFYIDHEEEANYFSLREEGRGELLAIAFFDLLINNTDRKGGHCLKGRDGRVWAIDHGLTFHASPKLRTVIWDFCGQPFPPALLKGVERLGGALEDTSSALVRELGELLSLRELDALRRRAAGILRKPRFPRLDEYRHLPWPPI